jgi:hypothetical protein
LKLYAYILSLILLVVLPSFRSFSQDENCYISFDFYGDSITFRSTQATDVPFNSTLSDETIDAFYNQIASSDYQPIVDALLAYKKKHVPDDWVYYQLIRRTAQNIAPKADNYYRYTLYKWFLLCKSGYNATLNIKGDKLLFYVQSDDDIYDIPYFTKDGKKFICLNYHDYGYNIDFATNDMHNMLISIPGAENSFSYNLSHLPDFRPENYVDKKLEFSYRDINYHFNVKMSDEVKKMFANYPVADYHLYFNAPLSSETYNSLIPELKKNVKGLGVKQGIDYLMHFTRYAFGYLPDQENFGREKHLSPEQTLLYGNSDCEDRAALFYYLVKEIYNRPMIVLAFPHHLTIAVKFDKPIGQPILFNGSAYSICEPTPQLEDLPLGALSPDLKTTSWEVAFSYDPSGK